jgi:hypothetical protein
MDYTLGERAITQRAQCGLVGEYYSKVVDKYYNVRSLQNNAYLLIICFY